MASSDASINANLKNEKRKDGNSKPALPPLSQVLALSDAAKAASSAPSSSFSTASYSSGFPYSFPTTAATTNLINTSPSNRPKLHDSNATAPSSASSAISGQPAIPFDGLNHIYFEIQPEMEKLYYRYYIKELATKISTAFANRITFADLNKNPNGHCTIGFTHNVNDPKQAAEYEQFEKILEEAAKLVSERVYDRVETLYGKAGRSFIIEFDKQFNSIKKERNVTTALLKQHCKNLCDFLSKIYNWDAGWIFENSDLFKQVRSMPDTSSIIPYQNSSSPSSSSTAITSHNAANTTPSHKRSHNDSNVTAASSFATTATDITTATPVGATMPTNNLTGVDTSQQSTNTKRQRQ